MDEFIFNITFIIEPAKERDFIDVLRNLFLPKVVNADYGAANPSLLKVGEVGGKMPDENHGLSIAFQLGFPNYDLAKEWEKTIFQIALEELQANYEGELLYFNTLLQNLSI